MMWKNLKVCTTMTIRQQDNFRKYAEREDRK